MMIKFREVLNPNILNKEWINFNGDSEYINEDGELIMGNWSFIGIVNDAPTNREELEFELENGLINDSTEFNGINWTLDDMVDTNNFGKGLQFEVENDNGHLCLVEFNY